MRTIRCTISGPSVNRTDALPTELIVACWLSTLSIHYPFAMDHMDTTVALRSYPTYTLQQLYAVQGGPALKYRWFVWDMKEEVAMIVM